MGIEAGSSTYYQAKRGIVQDGLVLHLDAGVKESYGGAGNTWYDLSGNGNNATFINGAIPNRVKGGSVILDGTNDYISIASNQNTRLENEVQTVTLMILIRSVGPNSYASIYGPGKQFIKWQSNLIGLPVGGTGTYFYSNTISMSNAFNSWMEITAIINWQLNTFTIYKNGSLVNSISITPSGYVYTGSGSASIGLNSVTGNSGDFMKGSIAITRIYSRALSANEVQQNFNATRHRFGI
jgi:hypothetical protein